MRGVLDQTRFLIRQRFGDSAHTIGMAELKPQLHALRAHPNLAQLRLTPQPGELHTIRIADISPEILARAKQRIAGGEWMSLHAAAGEGTRLAMGTKYLITPQQLLERRAQVLQAITDFNAHTADTAAEGLLRTILGEKDLTQASGKIARLQQSLQKPIDKENAADYLPLSFGSRHMLGMAYDLVKLAEDLQLDSKEVLARKKLSFA